MNSRKFILFIAFLFVTIISYGQTFNYSYTDPCTGVVKTMQIPTNGITVTYYGEVNTFQPSDFYNGGFESWAQGVYSSFGNNNPCASVVGLPTGINIAQNTATNFLSIVNSLSAISDLAALNGATNILSGVGSVSNASGNGGKKENKKGGNGTTTTNSEGSTQTPSGSSTPSGTSGNQGTSSESSGTSNTQGSNTTGSTQSTQTGNQPSQPPVGSQQNQSGSNGSTNNNTSGSNSSGTSNTSGSTNNTQSSTGSNQTQTTNGTQTNGTQSGNTSSGSSNANSGNANQNGSGTSGSNGSSNQNGSGSNTAGESKGSGTENQQGGSEATKTEEGGKTNLVGGSVASIGNSTGSGSASSESRKPTILGSSDFVGFNFRDSDVSQGAKVTGGYTSLRWDGQRSHGILVDYTTALKGPNITGFYAIIKKKRIDLISTTLTLGFDRKTSVYGTLALGQMWNIDKKKKFKAVYMLTGSFGSVYGEEFVGTAAIAGVMYDLKVSKRIDIKLMGLYVYAPYVSYYNDILLKSPHVVLPIIGTNIGLTKRFKLNINGGGAWAINENALNYTIMMGTRFLL